MKIENGKYQNMFNYQQIQISTDDHDDIYPMQPEVLKMDIDQEQISKETFVYLSIYSFLLIVHSAEISTHQVR